MDQNNFNESTQNTNPVNESVQNTQPINVQPQYTQVPSNTIPEEYKPISMWGYFGYEILFAIPLIGFILLLVFSFGGARNINLRNFARSYFCGFLIFLIIGGILFILFGGFAALSSVSETTRTMY